MTSAIPDAEPDLVDLAVELARAAGELTLQWFDNPSLVVDSKGDGSPVTQADRAAERLLRERLADLRPDDAIIGEEEHDKAGTSGLTWMIDPIDGTKAFTRGVPLYSNLVAVIDEHGPAVGVINLPALGQTVAAGRGLGATLDGAACRVSDRDQLAGAYVCTSESGYWPRSALDALLDSGVELRTWGDAYGYALVASGRADMMIDPLAHPWDVAPIAVILEEAGGRFTTVTGESTWNGGSGVGTNAKLHDRALEWFTSTAG